MRARVDVNDVHGFVITAGRQQTAIQRKGAAVDLTSSAAIRPPRADRVSGGWMPSEATQMPQAYIGGMKPQRLLQSPGSLVALLASGHHHD